MAQELSFDTSFLIDIQKEIRAHRKGPAVRFLERHSNVVMLVSAVTIGEFAEGFAAASDANLARMLAAFEPLEVDVETALLYGLHARRLRNEGRMIGGNDLWIGCCALRRGVPLVTGNPLHFERITGLQVITY